MLSSKEIKNYKDHGYVAPIDVLSLQETVFESPKKRAAFVESDKKSFLFILKSLIG